MKILHEPARPLRRLLQPVLGAGLERRAFAEPAHHRVDVLTDVRLIVGSADHVAAADVEVVGESDRDRHRRDGFFDRTVGGVDRRDRRRESRRQHHNVVADPVRPTRDLARVTAVVVVLVVAGPDHVLHGESAVDEVAIGGDVHLFEVVQQ